MLTDTILRNRYKILKELGRGGFSVTYLAVDMDLPGNPKCVVKQLKTRQSSQTILQIAKKLFNREAQVLYRLGKGHKQIPEMLAHFEENDEFYLVQEFVDGYDLTKEIKLRHRLGEDKVIKLLQEILEVLAFVHENNVIHRDIKLRNIMRRREDGKIVLIDFGAVKEIKGLVKNEQGYVNSTLIIGTPGYMPDEQANGKPRLCSDVYAVGMLGIQALTGMSPRELPFNPDNGELIWRGSANVSDRLAEILTGMVRHHFSQRYQTAAEALTALKSPVLLRPKTSSASYVPPRSLPSTVSKSYTPVLQTLGLFGLMGVGFGLGVFGWSFFQSNINTNQPTLTTTDVQDTLIQNINPSNIPKTIDNPSPKIFLPFKPRIIDSKTKPIFLPFIPFFKDNNIQVNPEISQSKAKRKKVKSLSKHQPKPIRPQVNPTPKNPIIGEEKANSASKVLKLKSENNQESVPSISIPPSKNKEIENYQTSLPSTPLTEDKHQHEVIENYQTSLPSTPPTEDKHQQSENLNPVTSSASTPPTEDKRQQSENLNPVISSDSTPLTEDKHQQSENLNPVTSSASTPPTEDKHQQQDKDKAEQPQNQISPSPELSAIDNESPSPLPTPSPVKTTSGMIVPTTEPPQNPVEEHNNYFFTVPSSVTPTPETHPQPTFSPQPSTLPESKIQSSVTPQPSNSPEAEIESMPQVSPSPSPEAEIESTPQVSPSPSPEAEIESTPQVSATSLEAEIESTPQVSASPSPKSKLQKIPKISASPSTNSKVESTPSSRPAKKPGLSLIRFAI